MDCTPDVNSYLFTVTGLPTSITSDMVIISANKGDRLRVNAQAWGDENAGKFKLVLSLTFANFSVCVANPMPLAFQQLLALQLTLIGKSSSRQGKSTYLVCRPNSTTHISPFE
jgi:hypothetical protein